MTILSDRKVLIVDDEPAVQLVLDRALSSAGYETTLASSGEEALVQLAEGEFEVMLLDIMMPGISGLDVLRTLKRVPKDPYVILVTAVVDVEQAVEAMKGGAFDYITKPFKIDDVLGKVREARDHRYLSLMKVDQERDFREVVAHQAKTLRDTNIRSIKELVEQPPRSTR